MSEHDTDATPASTMYTPLIPSHPRLRFIEDAGDGAAGNGSDTDDEKATGDDASDGAKDGADESLGDAGKQALDRMKAERNAARAEARTKEAELKTLREAAALKDKPAEEQEIEAAKAEARTEATVKANERILKADLRAAATGKLADPTDAALYINLADFTVSEDGETDSDALNDAIADLLEKKPHLAAVKQNRFDGDADQGAKGKDSKPSQLSQTDLKGMSPEQIVEAKAAGQLNSILGIK